MTVYILGGGPAGLAAAHGMALESKSSFVLIEKDKQPGGLAQTIPWDPHGFHDLGPHKIFTIDQGLMKRVEGLLDEDQWLTRPKLSSIYMKGHYLPYPPSPFSLVHVYGMVSFLRMVIDYGFAMLRSLFGRKTPTTFKNDLEGRLGKKLYQALFEPIAFKLWGDPAHLDAKLSLSRVQTPSLFETLGRLLKIKKSSEFEALTFKYPKGGLQKIWESMLGESKETGQFLFEKEITRIKVHQGRVTEIVVKDLKNGEENKIEVGSEDFVFSTLPIKGLLNLMDGGVTDELSTMVEETVRLNDLSLVFLMVDQPSLLDDCWVFVPDPDVIFHRLSEQESFDPNMVTQGSVVCCEIMSNDTRPTHLKTDEELIKDSLKGLSDMGYKGFKVIDQRVIRIPASYPVFCPGFEPQLKKILNEMDRFENFRTIGRQGAFNYIGTLDAMDIGYGAARWLNQNGTLDKQAWHNERERTSHYPILD